MTEAGVKCVKVSYQGSGYVLPLTEFSSLQYDVMEFDPGEKIELEVCATNAAGAGGEVSMRNRTVYRLDQVIDMIREACAQAGSQYQWATKHKLSPQYVTDLLKGRRTPGPAVLKIFKLEAVTQYREAR